MIVKRKDWEALKRSIHILTCSVDRLEKFVEQEKCPHDEMPEYEGMYVPGLRMIYRKKCPKCGKILKQYQSKNDLLKDKAAHYRKLVEEMEAKIAPNNSKASKKASL